MGAQPGAEGQTRCASSGSRLAYAVIYAVYVTARRSGGNEMPLFLGRFASVPITLAKWFGEVAERGGGGGGSGRRGRVKQRPRECLG